MFIFFCRIFFSVFFVMCFSRWSAAAPSCKELFSTGSSAAEPLSLKLLVAKELFFSNQHQKAAQAFLEILAQNPQHGEALSFFGKTQFNLKNYPMALQAQLQALPFQKPQFLARSHFDIARTQFFLKDLDAAEASARKAKALRKNYIQAMGLLAQILIAKEQKDIAQSELDQILVLDPNNLYALGLKTHLFLTDGEVKAATVTAQRMLQIDPSNKEAQNMMTQALLLLKKPSMALFLSDKVYSQHPKDLVVLGLRALALIQAERPLEGLAMLDKKIARGGGTWQTLGMRVDTLITLKRGHEALEGAQNLEPGFHRTFYTASAQIILGRYRDALQTLDAPVEQRISLLIKKAQAYYLDGQILEARKILIRLVQSSKELDRFVVAALLRIETQDFAKEAPAWLTELARPLGDINHLQRLSSSEFWTYKAPPGEFNFYSSSNNNFWQGLHYYPVDGQTWNSTR